jgi:bis(5'-nucleosyl)-tetraphosphatase (symmetrical)
MALYLIGDVQGCNASLGYLLDTLGFSPSRDTVFLLGDLINRGPDNVGVLKRLQALDNSAKCLLGNHDLHLLGVHLGVRKLKPGDTVGDLLQSQERDSLMDWLRQQALALMQDDVLMVHAGVLPTWSTSKTLSLASEVSAVLQSTDWQDFIRQMYGNLPAGWHDGLQGIDRLRVIVNGLTRLRYCTPEGEMEFAHHGATHIAPEGYVPWFEAPDRQTADVTIAFGHWSSLPLLQRQDVWALDSGCVWGRGLTAMHLHALGPGQHQRITVDSVEKR